MKNKFTLSAIFLAIGISTLAQVSLNQFPKNKQLYPRNVSTNQGTAVVSGTVSSTYTSMRLKVYRDTLSNNTYNQNLTFVLGSANFSFSVPVTAELLNYRFDLFGVNSGGETLIQSATEVVAGDAYIINGQSNSVANMYLLSGNGNQNPFIRSFGNSYPDAWAVNDKNWYMAEGDGLYNIGAIGQWGLKTARWIVDNIHIPVAVINGGVGGTYIQQHVRNNLNPTDAYTIYGRLLQRMTNSGLKNNVRGIWWHQGESDGALGRSVLQYKNDWKALRNSWKLDYPTLEHYFTFQIRQGCGVPIDNILNIVEAQRQLPSELADVHVVSTNGATQNTDNCHFPFIQGYELFADRLIPQVATYMYGQPAAQDMLPPDIISARLVASNLIELTFANVTSASMVADPGISLDFRLEGLGTGTSFLFGAAAQNKVYLVLGGLPALPSTISYYGHQTQGPPVMRTAGNNAALCFSAVPVVLGSVLLEKKDDPALTEFLAALEDEAPELATSVKEALQKSVELMVAPNPAGNVSTLYFNKDQSWSEIKLSDVNGRVVINRMITTDELNSGKADLNLDQLNSGVYVLSVSGQAGLKTSRLIKQ